MKKYFLIVCLLASVSVVFAQKQHGYVKTRGRLSANGTAIPGTMLSGATITFRGNNSAVSGTNGAFAFAVTNNTYCITNVRKNGYQLYDRDLLGKIHKYTSNDLLIVMDIPDKVLADRLELEKKIRRTLRKQLQEKEEKIEALKEQQKISEEQYRKQLQELYTSQENNEKLISEMADRYSTFDFDQIDDFYRRVNFFIENGELTRADSLLGTRGDICSQVRNIIQQGSNLHDAEERLNKAKNVHLMDVEEASLRCLSYYESMKLQCQYDSAAYYLRLYTELDSTDVIRLVNLGDFEDEFLDDGYGFRYYEKALYLANKMYDIQSVEVGICNNRMGEWHSKELYKTAFEAESYLEKALNNLTAAYGENHREVARCYYNFGQMYISLSRGIFHDDNDYNNIVDSAKCYLNKAMMVYTNLYGENSIEMASCHLKLYELTSDDKYRNNALRIYQSINDGENKGLGDFYYQVGLEFYGNRNIYTPSIHGYFFANQSEYDDSTAIIKQIEDYEMAIVYLQNARSVYEKNLSEKYPKCEEIDFIVVQIEHEIELFKKALKTGNPIETLFQIWNDR